MIIITGTGRSGTSFLGKLYVELGFKVAGAEVWRPDGRPGIEEPIVNQLLAEIMQDLVIPAGNNILQKTLFSIGKKIIGQKIADKSLRGSLRKRSYVRNQILLHDMTKLDVLAKKYQVRILELSRNYQVIKAPGFCRTLGVWAAAGAPIEHVVVTMRKTIDVIKSQERLNALRFTDYSLAYNHYALISGYLMAAIADNNLPACWIQFPDFLEKPEWLQQQLYFPSKVSDGDFIQAFQKVLALKPR